jgi:hypothetical protein
MPSRTGAGTFDITASVETAATLVIGSLLSASRLERIAAQMTVDPTLPSLSLVLRTITARLFGQHYMLKAWPTTALWALMTVQTVYVNALLAIAADATTHSFGVRTAVGDELGNVKVSVYPGQNNFPSSVVPNCVSFAPPVSGCRQWEDVWNTYGYKLKAAIDAGRPILTPLTMPAGPPI